MNERVLDCRPAGGPPLAVHPAHARHAPAAAPLFERIAFVGIGLIGGSIARDVRRLGLAGSTVAADHRPESVRRALDLGLVDDAASEIAEAACGADLVVLCVPVGVSGEVAAAIAPALRPDAVVTDVGSVKARVIELVAPHLDMRRFVPGHPVAGTEDSGPDAAQERLFEGRRCILTPDERVDPGMVARVEALWRAMGAEVDRMEAAHHDRVLAITSHLPHLLAFNLVNSARSAGVGLEDEVLKYAADSFGDVTRIAASDPTLWRDVFLSNRRAVLEAVGRYIEDLMALQRGIRWEEGDELLERFAAAQAIRRGVPRVGPAPDPRALTAPEPAPAFGPRPRVVGGG